VCDEKRAPYQLAMIDHDGVDGIHAATLQVLSETGAYY
jgi:trimethylamine:corrinoid methyltransferase-like protein